jgi:glycine zipper 2TM protein
MTLETRRAFALFVLMAASTIGACTKKADNSALQQDSSLTRDLARAGADTTAQPQLKDVPPATAPKTATSTRTTPRPKTTTAAPKTSAPAPAPAPANPPAAAKGEVTKAAVTGSIAAGTTLALSSSDKVCTNTNKVGDRFTATVNSGATGSNGAAIPSGSAVTIELTELHRSENANDRIVMGFRVVSLTVNGKTYYPDAEVVTASVDRVAAEGATGDAAKKVAGGAVVGAIIGQVIGRKTKGTLIGAAVGAAAGGAAAAATARHEGCVNSGAPITIKLNQPLTVTVS